MGERSDDDERTVELEATVEHTTEKAWLVNNLMRGNQFWLPKSVATIIRERDEEGHILFDVKEWWANKYGHI